MTITDQLRGVSDAQISDGMIIGPAFATIRSLVLTCGQPYSRQRVREDSGRARRRRAMRTR